MPAAPNSLAQPQSVAWTHRWPRLSTSLSWSPARLARALDRCTGRQSWSRSSGAACATSSCLSHDRATLITSTCSLAASISILVAAKISSLVSLLPSISWLTGDACLVDLFTGQLEVRDERATFAGCYLHQPLVQSCESRRYAAFARYFISPVQRLSLPSLSAASSPRATRCRR